MWLYKLTIPIKEKRLKKKEILTVLFILTDISKWKTEKLYLELLAHPRFNPILGIAGRPGKTEFECKEQAFELKKYLDLKNYPYIELINTYSPTPDIVVYTEPYGGAVPRHQQIYKYFGSLFLSINYSCHTTHLAIDYFSLLHQWAWIDCYENLNALIDAYDNIGYERKSLELTGLPMIDQLLDKPLSDPWKKHKPTKKRIIWAPHHSLGGFDDESIIYSTFIQYSDLMLNLARKYEKELQFAFKPHPLLKYKLDKIWGKDRADEYYNAWANLPNGQLEEGAYQDLFYYSDALIHDCSSFIVEYQVMDKPTLFLVRNQNEILADLNSFGQKAFFSQNLAYDFASVEKFLKEIINGKDPQKTMRQDFLRNEIVGYTERNASCVIINRILEKL